MAWNFLIQIAVAIALNVLAYILAPKPKSPKPPAASDWEDPTAEAGRPLPVVFGTITVKGLNILWFGDKKIKTYEVRA